MAKLNHSIELIMDNLNINHCDDEKAIEMFKELYHRQRAINMDKYDNGFSKFIQAINEYHAELYLNKFKYGTLDEDVVNNEEFKAFLKENGLTYLDKLDLNPTYSYRVTDNVAELVLFLNKYANDNFSCNQDENGGGVIEVSDLQQFEYIRNLINHQEDLCELSIRIDLNSYEDSEDIPASRVICDVYLPDYNQDDKEAIIKAINHLTEEYFPWGKPISVGTLLKFIAQVYKLHYFHNLTLSGDFVSMIKASDDDKLYKESSASLNQLLVAELLVESHLLHEVSPLYNHCVLQSWDNYSLGKAFRFNVWGFNANEYEDY